MLDLQIINDMASDAQRSSSGERPYFATVTQVVSARRCKLRIDGDTEAVDTTYCCIQLVSVGDRVCLYYAGNQIIVMGAV